MTGDQERQRAFVLRLAELSEAGAWKDMTASLAHEINRPDLAVAVARQSIRAGTPLVRNGYPVLSIMDGGAEPYAVEMPLVHAIVRQESSFDVRAVSPAGAQGLMQLMPALADEMGVTDPFDPRQNIMAGAKYLRWLLDLNRGDVRLTLAGYNAGPTVVSKYKRVPPFKETQRYVKKITGFMDDARKDTIPTN
jgi:soluble lytic murein transglycosylase-like protein